MQHSGHDLQCVGAGHPAGTTFVHGKVARRITSNSLIVPYETQETKVMCKAEDLFAQLPCLALEVARGLPQAAGVALDC
uniref:Uncharacterized protein n=1 Tax=Peronospora matthiolae TaxID=2874970 RepID=A0AAV1TBM3_9STRA